MRRGFVWLALVSVPFTSLRAEPTINFVEWIGKLAKLTIETEERVECVAFYGDKRAGSGADYPTAGVATVYISIPSGLAPAEIRFECSDQ